MIATDPPSARGLKQDAEDVAASPWVERLARFGYIVRGVLYGLAGLLTMLFAAGYLEHAASRRDAVETLAQQPFGNVLLVLITVGLVGYTAWGLIRAMLDPLGKGTDAKGIAQRLGYLVSAASYALLLVLAVQLLANTQRLPMGGAGAESSDGSQAQELTGWVLAQPLGAWIVGIAGLWMIGAGLGEAYKAIKATFAKEFDRRRMSATELQIAERLGRVGHGSRAVVFTLIGIFIVKAAVEANPGQVRGLGGALEELATQPFGPPLLFVVALGLVAFGIFSAMHARWMHMDVPGDARDSERSRRLDHHDANYRRAA
ncbi:MAG TPA: DUF1206 domain-containing protein [Chloroflexota bacterium]|nr:DUF1206 domain-containing protein [Chloroflexota bacterium]